MTFPAIIADVGATNARFGFIHDDGQISRSKAQIYLCDDHASFESAYAAYVAYLGDLATNVQSLALAIAGPITGDLVRMTNHPWAFSQKTLKTDLGLNNLVVVNDFTAVALSLSVLTDADTVRIGGDRAGRMVPNAPKAVLGAGSGLGVSGLIPHGCGGWVPLSGEGGHVTLAPANDREAEILHVLRDWFGHVSVERVLCGAGLVNLYKALAHLAHHETQGTIKPADITKWALNGADPLAVEALTLFCAMLGTVAGNLSLILGARGGLYVAGGIVPQILPFFKASPFRDRFKAKGRFEDYLAAIPTLVITHELPAFLGLCAALKANQA
jgi:glucokinase